MFGEILICQFPFTSGVVSKVRPALVLFDLQQDVLICRVTSGNAPVRWTSYWSIGRQPGCCGRPSPVLIES
jgi:hypothetical protein